jgi:hypothetical protein
MIALDSIHSDARDMITYTNIKESDETAYLKSEK